MGITCGRWTDLAGDEAAGAKTGEVQGPRVLGFEQILAGDFRVLPR